MASSIAKVTIAYGLPSPESCTGIEGVGRLPQGFEENIIGVRHARYAGPTACLAALTAMKLRDELRVESDRIGIICNGGPWNLQASWSFIERARKFGPRLVNPLLFSPTLVSATPTTAAACVGAHAFAYAVGHDRFAFFDVLHRAAQSLRFDFADHVFALAVASKDPVIARVIEKVGILELYDVAIGFAVSRPSEQEGLHLIDVRVNEHREKPLEGFRLYEARWNNNYLSFNIKTPLAKGEALGATGGIIIAAAVKHHLSLPARQRQEPFAVTCRDKNRYAIAKFHWRE